MFIPFLTQNENISFLEGLSVTATCVLIVFAMLIILALAVALFQFIKGGDKKVEEVAAPVVSAPQPKPSLKLEDVVSNAPDKLEEYVLVPRIIKQQ